MTRSKNSMSESPVINVTNHADSPPPHPNFADAKFTVMSRPAETSFVSQHPHSDHLRSKRPTRETAPGALKNSRRAEKLPVR
jgi:hypothetical protein